MEFLGWLILSKAVWSLMSQSNRYLMSGIIPVKNVLGHRIFKWPKVVDLASKPHKAKKSECFLLNLFMHLFKYSHFEISLFFSLIVSLKYLLWSVIIKKSYPLERACSKDS